nr:hypothetical protein [Tanacetum cinerariifolium]
VVAIGEALGGVGRQGQGGGAAVGFLVRVGGREVGLVAAVHHATPAAHVHPVAAVDQKGRGVEAHQAGI